MMWAVAIGLVLFVLITGLWYVLQTRPSPFPPARTRFHLQREHLEARFFEQASSSGKPRGLRWLDCQWEDAVEFARDRSTGQIIAFVGITLQFEAIPGSDMEGLPAVGNLRNASAVFLYHKGNWLTQGRAIFNLNPDETIQRYQHQYERLQEA